MILAGVEGAEDAGRAQGRRGRGVRLGLRRHDLQGGASEGGRDLLLDLRGDQGSPGAGEEIPRLGRSDHRQFLRDAEFSAVFSDGSFVYVPPGVRCPMELSTYFRINAENTGQFERTLIIADKGSYVSYLEGCTAPQRDTHQLHAAVVELVALDDAEIKYSTVQNWYPGDENGKGGIYNFVTKRADCRGDRSKVMWTQVETGSAITWKYPSCILRGDDSQGEFYSIAIANNAQQADTGTKMVHLGKQHEVADRVQGDQRGRRRTPIAGSCRCTQGQGKPQLHPVRQPSDRRQVRGAHGSLYRGEEQLLPRGA
jgi:hypothetical protein